MNRIYIGINVATGEEVEKPHHINYWWEGRKDGWAIQFVDEHDNQIGDCEYHGLGEMCRMALEDYKKKWPDVKHVKL